MPMFKPPGMGSGSFACTSTVHSSSDVDLVPKAGLEPARISPHAPQTCASTNSATWASIKELLLLRGRAAGGAAHHRRPRVRLHHRERQRGHHEQNEKRGREL